jgi:hypothetical protein
MKAKDDEKLDEVKAILRRLQRIGTGDEEGAAPVAERSLPSHDGSRREWTRHKTASSPGRVKNTPSAPHAASVPTAKAERRSTSPLLKVAFAAVPVLLVLGLGLAFWPELSRKLQPTSPTDKAAELSEGQQFPAETERSRATATMPQPAQQQSRVESSLNLQSGTEPATSPLSEENAERISSAQRLIDEGKVVAGRDLLLDGLAEQRAEAALILARSYDPNSLRLILNADAQPDVEAAERWYRRWHEIAVSEGLALDIPRLDRIIKAMR